MLLQLLLLPVACVLLPTVHCQIINSFAGPFDVELRRIENCPGSMGGLNLLNFTQRLTRDRKYPKRFYYTGVVQQFFDFTPSVGASVRLSSWSARGGWKENAYSHVFPRLCDLVAPQMSASFKRNMHAALGKEFNPSCPVPAARWEFVEFPVDVSTGNFKEFVYGKWRVDIQLLDGSTILSCYREFVDTVPRVRSRVPPEANFSGTVTYSPLKSLHP